MHSPHDSKRCDSRAGSASTVRAIVRGKLSEGRVDRERAAAARMLHQGTSDQEAALDRAVDEIRKEIARDARAAMESKVAVRARSGRPMRMV